MDYDALLKTFPPVSFGIAYGSGVFTQTGYARASTDNGASNKDAAASPASKAAPSPMIDLILAVDDPVSWHSENLRRNSAHYSGLRALGPRGVAAMQDEWGARIYYNTRVPIPSEAQPAPSQMMKYGVISVSALLEDLVTWRSLYVAGRMHKPVRVIACEQQTILRAATQNCCHALRAALLMLPQTFTSLQLYTTVAGLSYTGDWRMVFGENPHKVRNIVTGSLQHFHALYLPLLASYFPTVTRIEPSSTAAAALQLEHPVSGGGADRWVQDTSPEARLALGMSLPHRLQRHMALLHAAASGSSSGSDASAGGAGGGAYKQWLAELRQARARASQRTLGRARAWAVGGLQSSTGTATATAASIGEADADGRVATTSGVKQAQARLRLPRGAYAAASTAVTKAEAGLALMERARLQRKALLLAMKQRIAHRLSNDDTMRYPQVEVEALLEAGASASASVSASSSGFGKARADPAVTAFWEDLLHSHSNVSSGVGPGDGALPSSRLHAVSAGAGVGAGAGRGGDLAPSITRYLRPAVANIVGAHARTQSVKGILTAGPLRAALYSAEKLQKYFAVVLRRR